MVGVRGGVNQLLRVHIDAADEGALDLVSLLDQAQVVLEAEELVPGEEGWGLGVRGQGSGLGGSG